MANDTLVKHGEQKFREADSWWLVHDLAVGRYRSWVLLWLGRRRLRQWLGRRGALRLVAIDRQIEEAHDRILIEAENIRSAAHCASSSEMAGRIYYEEHDGHETYRLAHQDPGVDD